MNVDPCSWTVTSTFVPTAGDPQPDVTCGDGVGDVAFICALYQDILGRPADASGLSTYQAQLSGGTSRCSTPYPAML